MALWQITKQFDPAMARLADRHYSRKSPGTKGFVNPGYNLILYVPGPTWPFQVQAGWIWYRSLYPRLDGHDGYYLCSLFRNESSYLASDLIRDAVQIVNEIWGLPPHGYDTYVWPERLTPIMQHGKPVYGWCYRKAGWTDSGQWTKDGRKLRLFLPRGEEANG